MLTRACCCGDDPAPPGCNFGNPVPNTICVSVRLQGVTGHPSPNYQNTGPGTPGILQAFSGVNTTYTYTYTNTLSNYPGVGLAEIRCNDPPFGCQACAVIRVTGVRMFLALICRGDGTIGVRELVVDLGMTGVCIEPGSAGGSDVTGVIPADQIFRRVTTGSFPLNVAIANSSSASGGLNLGGGGTAIVTATAGPCSGLMALRTSDQDAVARQIAALEDPLARQRRASGCRGCGDAGGDALV